MIGYREAKDEGEVYGRVKERTICRGRMRIELVKGMVENEGKLG